MESELSPDKEHNIPPIPLKTYQWEDLRRAREAGGYPWTHLYKTPLEGEITAEDIIRATTPRRSMSREFSRSRTHSPVDKDIQKILNLDSSPGSSRKHNEEGEDEGVHIPNFSKEISLDSEDDTLNQKRIAAQTSENQNNALLMSPIDIPKNVSPKSILKRRAPEQQYIGVTETREKTKCCHPLVNKIKHLADKTLHKLERSENERSPLSKRKKNEEVQEIRQLRNSPGAVRRQKFSAIKLGSSDEMSKNMSIDTPPPRKRKEHIYEDIDEGKDTEIEKISSSEIEKQMLEEENKSNSNKENDSIFEKKSIASHDPSLLSDDNISLKPDEHIMEKLHNKDNTNKEAVLLDEELDTDEPNVEEIFQNQVHDARPRNDSPNITITEIIDDDADVTNNIESSPSIPIETSPSPSPREHERKRNEGEFFEREWSKPSSDHEYEIIEKPAPNITYTAPSVDEPPTIVKADDDVSSTTSIERKYLQHTSDEEEQLDDKENFADDKNDNILSAEALQKDIEDRFFVNTPSTVSRTECEVSTSQVDSSALENLPLKRENRNKMSENVQQRIKEGTGKLKTQAGKLKTKLQNMKTKQFSLPEKSKFKIPERPKFTFPDRPKFTLPDRRKFSLPDRPKFKKINISEKLSFGDRKKFTVPEMPKFKMPERPKINFPSIGKKKSSLSESGSDLQNVATVEFEAKTYPRLFSRKKKPQILKISSSPTLNREETPPPTFTFTRVKDTAKKPSNYIPDSPTQPREYGAVDEETNYENQLDKRKRFDVTYDFDKVDTKYLGEINNQLGLKNTDSATSTPDISPSVHEFTHINEINNDEFFVRPRGISRENIQVREYLSDEIRQAFNIPKNVLAVMGSDANMNKENMYADDLEADPDLMMEDNEQLKYSTEDINERDDGYYTFPPIRPSRAKRKKKEAEQIQYIDGSTSVSMQFSEVDLGLSEDHIDDFHINENIDSAVGKTTIDNDFRPSDLRSIHEYANDDVIEYPEAPTIQSQTLPMPPKRKKKTPKKDLKHSSLNDFNKFAPSPTWEKQHKQVDDIIVYRTEHEYIVPQVETDRSPVPPSRNRSRSSRTTSFCDDDRTSHGAESLTLDTQLPLTHDVEERDVRHESPGYATVDKGAYIASSKVRRSKSKTPPTRRRKSNSSERKYYTVSGTKSALPSRPPRKKSSTSLTTLDSFTKRSMNGDYTQYDEIEEPHFEEVHRDLKSGQVLSKMKDRPLPPPPRPPRGSKQKKRETDEVKDDTRSALEHGQTGSSPDFFNDEKIHQDIVEIEVSTQTDPLPDDIDFEIDEHLDLSMSSSLRDIIDEESIIGKSRAKRSSPHVSRSVSRSEKSLKMSDPKISELSKSNIGRTSPTVILIEKRVSSPTRINERDEILTEASLTVQHIDIDESQIPDVPPLPRSRGRPTTQISNIKPSGSQSTLPVVLDTSREAQLDNLVTQRLQVRDLDVGRLNVSELQASKILVSEIEGMTLNVNELESKSGHISVSGIEFSPSVIDEIVRKFAEISTNAGTTSQTQQIIEIPRPVSREEETQTEQSTCETKLEALDLQETEPKPPTELKPPLPPPPSSSPAEDSRFPPQRPPLPDFTPLLFSYLQDLNNVPTTSNYQRQPRDRPLSEHLESLYHAPPPPVRRGKRKPAAHRTESSSEEDKPRPSPRRLAPVSRIPEPTVTEAGAQFLRVCQNSISRTLRNIFHTFMSYINRAEDKKDVQMAMVIFLVLIAGLIMFGLSDSRTIHHHHWEFFNPPDNNK